MAWGWGCSRCRRRCWSLVPSCSPC